MREISFEEMQLVGGGCELGSACKNPEHNGSDDKCSWSDYGKSIYSGALFGGLGGAIGGGAPGAAAGAVLGGLGGGFYHLTTCWW